MVVQVAQRTAPAGHVDQVVGAAEQAEAPVVDQFQHVGHRRRLGNEVAFEDEALGAVGVVLGTATRISPKVSQTSLCVGRRVATWPDSVLP